MTEPRGFPAAEFQARTARAQARMAELDIGALLLTTEADLRYFTGFLTRFWESPTRPWFLIVPAYGQPVAVIPSIGAHLMRQSWIEDIRTWPAPVADDDGISLLSETLAELAPAGCRIAVPGEQGTVLRMPLNDFNDLQKRMSGYTFTHDGGLMRNLRMIKSDTEIARIRAACAVADRAFARVAKIAHVGTPLSDVFRRFQILCLEEGADWVPYLAGGAAQGGYRDVISPADDTPLAAGDVLMLDTGVVRDGYFCDFDRNFSIGPATVETKDAHARLIDATHAAFEIAKPGRTAADLFETMAEVLGLEPGSVDTGRLGHGLGMQLTEPPSLIPSEMTVLQPGMVLTLEPGIPTGPGMIMVHEENIVIRENGAEWLSTPWPREIVEIGS